MASLRRDIASGLIVVAPIAVALLAVRYLFRQIAGLPAVGAIEPVWLRVPVVIVVFLGMVLAVGYGTRTAIGTFITDMIGRAINRIPGLRVVYNASQLAVETAFRQSERRTRPVKIESWHGLRVTAFFTGNWTEDGRMLCFFPTAPNITTGYVIEVDEEDVTPVEEGIEHALTRLLSAGLGDRSHPRGEEIPVTGARIVGSVGEVRIKDKE